MMTRFFALWCLLLVCVPARAGFYRSEEETGNIDGHRLTRIWWPGWNVSSSEDLWKHQDRTPPQFPLSHLFDGDARTTWAAAGSREKLKGNSLWRALFGLAVESDNVRRIDELWIMNGYNKRRDLFVRNDRVVEMEIWINDRKVKSVRLSDRMGWHKIKLPPNNFRRVGLLFTGVRKGEGPDNDVCISELKLLQRGREIEMQMPNSLFFEDGNNVGDAPLDCAFITARGGKVITQGVRPENGLHNEKWSPRAKYVGAAWRTNAKAASGRNKNLLWIADLRGRIIRRELLPDRPSDPRKELAWLNEKTLEVRWTDSDDSFESIKTTVLFRKQFHLK